MLLRSLTQRYTKLVMNESEALFENIFNERKIKFDKIPESDEPKERRPDYKVSIGCEESYWEIKQLDENDAEKKILKNPDDTYSVNSQRVKNSIKSACDQFKSYGVTDKPCVIAFYDARDFMVFDVLFESHIKQAMLGIAEYTQQRNGSCLETKRTGRMLTKKNKTYVSAIVIMYKKTKKLVYFHNPNATKCLIDSNIGSLFQHHFKVIKTNIGLEWVKV